MFKLSNKDYLKRLIVTKRDLELFLYTFKDNKNDYDYFYWKTKDYLEIIENEIVYVKKQLSKKDKDFISNLITIYDLGV